MKLHHQRLARLAALRAAVASARPANALRGVAPDGLAELLGATCERNHYGEYLVVRRWFAEPEACAPSLHALRLLAPNVPEEAADPERWLFLDSETTGLAGGTGTYAFLVGVAWWDAGGLQVEQFFMRDHSEEHSLLLALRDRLAERRVLVTFNGKSFDWPLLETRFRMTRQITPRAPAAHLDLLHPARQLWRLRLGSVRLSELERHVAGFNRGFDIRSDLIPQIYFDYLRGGPAQPLVDVFRHNQMDLRGLAALAGKMLALAEAPETAAGDALDLYGLSRLVRQRGETDLARRLCESAVGAGLPADVNRAARRELALLAKRQGDYARATELWCELIHSEGRGGTCPARFEAHPLGAASSAPTRWNDMLEAYEQLAIYYEHHARLPERAAALTREALAALHKALRLDLLDAARYRRLRARLEHRLARLERKTAGALLVPR